MNNSFRSLALVSLLGLAGAVHAATMSTPVSAGGDFTVTDTTGPAAPQVYNFNIDPTTSPNPVTYYDLNPGSQDPSDIAALIASAYSVSASTLINMSNCENISGGCAGTTGTDSTFSLSGVPEFDYLAIHFGGGELFFHWAQPITEMTLTALDGFPGGLSNYRSYLTTPVPGALALFLGAMGLMGLRRKIAQPAAPAPAMA